MADVAILDKFKVCVCQKKKGPEGFVPRLICNKLCNAFESYMKIKQLNDHDTGITNKKLIEQSTMYTKSVMFWIVKIYWIVCWNLQRVAVPCSAFDVAFSREQNCAVWEECGTAPLTRACLQNSQVTREMGDDKDATNMAMVHIQESNHVSTHFCCVIIAMTMLSKMQLKRLAESQWQEEREVWGRSWKNG